MSWSSTKSKILGTIEGRYDMNYDGIQYPFPEEHLLKGRSVDEMVRGVKKTECIAGSSEVNLSKSLQSTVC
jgi:hypothetical protein